MKTCTAALLLLLLACGGSPPPPPPPVSNQHAPAGDPDAPSAPAPPEITVAMVAATGLPAGTGTLSTTLADTAGDAVAGATVVASSPALQGEQVAITDEQGRCEISNLPAGRYTITVYYNDLKIDHGVEVDAGQVTQLRVARWDLRSPIGEIIEIRGAP